jgi:pyrroloquinoline quinone biosynthesis protein B
MAVVPGLARFDDEVLRRLDGCSAVLVDGTFWGERELAEAGGPDVPASAMGHLPVGGRGGSLETVARLGIPRVIYFHINNTNPIRLPGSPERLAVEAAGVAVGSDGMEFQV